MNLREAFDRSNPDFVKGTPLWKHASFRILLDHLPQLEALTAYLPSDLETPVFEGQTDIETAWSSYKDHGYGCFFYALTRILKPSQSVELGVLQGFSLLTIAAALRDNGGGSIQGFDLFEDYPFHHENYANVLNRIHVCGLQTWAQIHRADAFQAHEWFDRVDILHVDVSNNGDTYRRIFEQWASKVRQAILFEGGSADRDRVEWMVKYGKPPIAQALKEISQAYRDWAIIVLEPFPSLTVAFRVA